MSADGDLLRGATLIAIEVAEVLNGFIHANQCDICSATQICEVAKESDRVVQFDDVELVDATLTNAVHELSDLFMENIRTLYGTRKEI